MKHILHFCFALGLLALSANFAFAEETCNGYNYMTFEGGVSGHKPWSGWMNLKTMRWELKHPGGGHVVGTVTLILCSGKKIAFQTYDEGQRVTNNCIGTISQNNASGKCNHNSFFRLTLLKQ